MLKNFFSFAGQRCISCHSCIYTNAFEFDSFVSGLCYDCQKKLSVPVKKVCPGCGLYSEDQDVDNSLCSVCIIEPVPWSRLFFYGPYEGLLRQLISGYKFKGQLSFVVLLQQLASLSFVNTTGKSLPDIIIPVPLHPRRLVWRGFNQSLEIARGLSRSLAVPVTHKYLQRIRNTTAQVHLGKAARLENLKSAFTVSTKDNFLRGKHVLLVDDILTTGATLKECCNTLKLADVSAVDVFVLARTML